jgi:hypothetical protein
MARGGESIAAVPGGDSKGWQNEYFRLKKFDFQRLTDFRLSQIKRNSASYCDLFKVHNFS